MNFIKYDSVITVDFLTAGDLREIIRKLHVVGLLSYPSTYNVYFKLKKI